MESGQHAVRSDDICAASDRLRDASIRLRQFWTRDQTIEALSSWAAHWFDPKSLDRRQARNIGGAFPYAMVEGNLNALLKSITPSAIQEIIDAEGVGDTIGVPLVGHVIASNTPLLVWTSVLRALIMQSASLVKLSSTDDGSWANLFQASLKREWPILASCIEIVSWPGTDHTLNAALSNVADLLLVYGSDQTIDAFKALEQHAKPVLGYGHRVSIGIVEAPAPVEDITGFARDILIYDQGGCLSPQVIFLLGTVQQAEEFSIDLANRLQIESLELGDFRRDAAAANKVRTHRTLARMAGCGVYEDASGKWTLINAGSTDIYPPGGYGIAHVRRISKLADILQWTHMYRNKYQGCAIPIISLLNDKEHYFDGLIQQLGISRVCRPGELQEPPISWRQDRQPVLHSIGVRSVA